MKIGIGRKIIYYVMIVAIYSIARVKIYKKNGGVSERVLCEGLSCIQGYLERSAWRRATMSKGERELKRLVRCCSSER